MSPCSMRPATALLMGIVATEAFISSPAALHAPRTAWASTTMSAGPVPGKSMLKSRPIGVGSCAPPDVIANTDLEAIMETSDDWISSRTGIRRRHVLTKDGNLAELAITAGKNAIENAGVDPADIDLVIVASSSPEDMFGDATTVAHAVGATKAVAFDLTAACSGFLFSVVTASQVCRRLSV
ncbi:unnamed protein product [Phaeothamnion confervicola]